MTRTALIVTATIVALAAGCGSKSRNEGDADAGDALDAPDAEGADVPAEVPDEVPDEPAPDPVDDPEEDAPADAAGDVAAEPEEDAEEDAGLDPEADAPDDAADAPADADAGEVYLTGCGNRTIESPEVCDDGNRVTEPCDTTMTGACLSDCSLLIPECGDGASDPGEACDDGNTSSMDSCTTSCTVNDLHMGAPCTCTSGCSHRDPSAGTISGCDNLASLANSSRELACLTSENDTLYDIFLHYAGGTCTLMARDCTGMGVCGLLPDIGDVSTFTCPTGYAMVTSNPALITTATVVMKTCHPLCTSDRDCRWNEEELSGSPWYPDCGEYRCVPAGDGGESICYDSRNPS